MELREAVCHSPLFVLGGNGGGLRNRGIRRTRTVARALYSCRRIAMLNGFKIRRLKSHNYMSKSGVESIRQACSATRAAGLCNVLWIVEADITDGQLLYITGDPVALGCWDPEMAIPLSPSWEHTNLWKTEIKVPFGIHFKYNYIIKGKSNPSHNLVWRPGPAFFLSIPLPSRQSENIMVRDMWLKTTIKHPADSLWNPWAVDVDPSAQIFKIEGHHESCRGGHKMLQSEKDTLVGDIFTIDLLTNDDTSCVGKNIKINGIDSGQGFSERDQPVEEPWFFRSILPSTTYSAITNDASDQAEVTKIELSGQECQNLVKLVDVNEHKLVRVEESVSTVILINSSVCTMQRIAILENRKLVELLLEPVKNNVHCDSVYLGVVTKLVPHMGGAFVDIGISRPSLMDIKQNREPFVYPPFSSMNKGQQLNGSIKTESKEHMDVGEDVGLYVDDSPGDDFLDAGPQDEFMHEDFDEHEDEDVIDVSDSHNESMTDGIGECDGAEVELEEDHEENGHHIESETVDDLTEMDLSDLTLQDPKDRRDTHSRKNKWAHVRKGTKVIVQVVKEGLGTKGPALSAYPNLRSRFWILISRCNRIGVSKKIAGAERTRLRVIAKTLQPPGFGLTVRTVAAGHSLEELQKDLEGLLSTWKRIVEHAKSAALAADEGVEGAVPVILHRAMGQTLSVVQDYFNDKVKSMVVDSPRTYHEVSNYLQEIAPDLCDRLVLYNKGTPMFDDYGIEEEINNILSKRVPLSNGGSLVIEQTEALVSIDVNGGHSMLGQGTSQERAVLDVNLAAARQIARELRLRDIGGIIVVDFIDMDDESNKRLVYEETKKAVERDKSIVKVSELSRHGLMEITRKRVRPSVSFLISEPCACCHGTGRVEALETSFSKIEREICRLLATSDQIADPENAKSWPRFVLKVDRYMCNYLTSGKRTKLAILSSSLKVWILLKVARGFSRGAFEVKPFMDDKANDEAPVTISRLQAAEARSYIPKSKLTLFPIKKWKTRGR